jgi:hypothetical protein
MPAMRWFTLVASLVFIATGILAITSGESIGWLIVGFFGLCLLVAIFEPKLPKKYASSGYKLVFTDEEIACEHWKRPRESIRWNDVIKIWYITTPDGPRNPDEWILLDGETGGCSFPTEAAGMDQMWDEIEQRFPGFDYHWLIIGPPQEAKRLCWSGEKTDPAPH